MTALALAGSGASLGASGPSAALPGAVAAAWALPPRVSPRIEARLIAPKPIPVRSRNSRRVKRMSLRVGVCSRRYLEVGSWCIRGGLGLERDTFLTLTKLQSSVLFDQF